MKHPTLLLLTALIMPMAHAAECHPGAAVQTVGDIPGAISYDVYSQLQPVTPGKLALFASTQQVKLLPNGTRACEVRDDGVTDPSAVLLKVPGAAVNYWVPRNQVRRDD